MSSTVLELKDVSILIPAKPQEIVLLGDISTVVPPGQFVAIVGPSGCGKSTLLKVIAGIIEPTFGGVNWNGRDLAAEDLEPHEIGYVPQFSIAYDLLTVEDNIATAVRLRVSGLNSAERAERVAAILQQVGLTDIADRQVRVLSGGQRRRLALALEMVTAPQLLLVDEVTSGLDPKAEDDLVQLMHALSRRDGRIVLNITHSLRNLSAYDTVVVLHGGQLAYHGPPEFLTHYFQIREPAGLFTQLSRRKPDEWHRSWKKHREPYQSPANLKDMALQTSPADRKTFLDKQTEPRETKPEEESEPVTTPGAFSQFFTLLGRRWRLFFKDSTAVWLQLALILGFPCLVVVFAMDGLPQIQNLPLQFSGNIVRSLKESADFVAQATRTGSLVSGLVMFQLVLLTLMGANNAAREVASERLIFEKEKFGGLSPIAYVASKAAFLLFLVLAQSVWMGVFVNMVCHFPGDIGTQIGVLTLANAAMTAVCLAISSFARTAEQASLISIYLVGFQLPLSGAVLALPKALGLIVRPEIAAYWGWSGFLQTLRDSRLYDMVTAVSQTQLSPLVLCLWVLVTHILLGMFFAVAGCKNSRWE